jgi:hypothetical protein
MNPIDGIIRMIELEPDPIKREAMNREIHMLQQKLENLAKPPMKWYMLTCKSCYRVSSVTEEEVEHELLYGKCECTKTKDQSA